MTIDTFKMLWIALLVLALLAVVGGRLASGQPARSSAMPKAGNVRLSLPGQSFEMSSPAAGTTHADAAPAEGPASDLAAYLYLHETWNDAAVESAGRAQVCAR